MVDLGQPYREAPAVYVGDRVGGLGAPAHALKDVSRMRRNASELSILRQECRKAQSVDDLKQILEAVLDHLYYVENDYWLQKPRERHGP